MDIYIDMNSIMLPIKYNILPPLVECLCISNIILKEARKLRLERPMGRKFTTSTMRPKKNKSFVEIGIFFSLDQKKIKKT
ncbi:MAG: hypothetical protein LBI70_02455 [Rickettsiales bacterium]|jgi:hypothetical protein|nr:hypothetical protein [Rickettsiales bacterium]